MENVPKLGRVIERDDKAERDAIHIAVAPLEAAEGLYPGSKVGLVDGRASTRAEHKIGVVDPFMESGTRAGDRVWVMLFPGTITSLRHEWLHPAFMPAPVKKISKAEHVLKSEAWIAAHAAALGLSADALMENAQEWLKYGDYFVQRDKTRWRDEFNPREFWHHYEIVTGVVVPEDKKGSMYCCSC